MRRIATPASAIGALPTMASAMVAVLCLPVVVVLLSILLLIGQGGG